MLPSLPHKTTEVLDSPSGWMASPEAAFASWLVSFPEPYAEKTMVVYCAMFGKFVTWIGSRSIPLIQCTAADVQSFLASTDTSSLHQQRYLRILGMVWGHLAELGLPVLENVGKREKRRKRNNGETVKPHVTSFLNEYQVGRLEELLQEVFDRPLPEPESKQVEWIELRDAAMVGMMLGAGMKLKEVLGWGYAKSYPVNRTGGETGRLFNEEGAGGVVPSSPAPTAGATFEVGDWITLPRFGPVPERRTRFYAIGQAGLAAWQRGRTHYGLDAPQWFPADVLRRRDDQAKPSARLDSRNAWRAISDLLARATLTGKLATTQALRNTYAAQLTRDGFSDAAIADMMGLKREVSATRIRLARDGHAHAQAAL